MRKSLFIAAVVLCLTSLAAAQDPGYYCIYGNRDGSTIDVYINSIINIEIWAATPGTEDPVSLIYNPLATDNDYIAQRYHGWVYAPLEDWYVSFTPLDTISQPGFTNRGLLTSCWFGPSPCNPLNTGGDTVAIAYFTMRTAIDSSLMGQTVCPFIEGYSPAHGTTLWGLISGVDARIPSLTFSCLYFVEYLAGDANGSGSVDGLDVLYLVNYLKGLGSPPDPIFSGDANGDCTADGLDVLYLVAYLKGGLPPVLGNCH
jgi:hypothetical protein